ncbi:MAG: hypothetical protein DRP64_13920 [Verrucomicrobia bacterium]|nr:MAG: hypothetical protein DRP64_13920 [Verrucomicrobiota bacterium]
MNGEISIQYLLHEVDKLAGNMAKEALKVARKTNGYAEVFLKGHRKLPKNKQGSSCAVGKGDY